ncbi:type VII secretion system-associated protein [Streptomyces sp. NPDC017991]|uniref:type VII secretion system-associated protein n=1 Tax=Streptomyces sp. NPDC017991 TaxID=3365026 RepID=UPI0037B5CB94
MRPGERQEGGHDALPVVPDGSGGTAVTESSVAGTTDVPVTADTVNTVNTSETVNTVDAAENPDIPEAVRAAARRAPGHWIGVVDPEWTEERTPPEWAVLGEWQSDESGGVGEYRANPAYRPSARVLGWPKPTDPVDAAAQRAATGYGSVDEALAALAEAEVTVVRAPDGGPLTGTGQDGAPVVLLFTSPAHEFMSPVLRHGRLPARQLARSLSGSGTRLMVNAGAAAPLLVPADSLLPLLPGQGVEGATAADAVTTEDFGTPSATPPDTAARAGSGTGSVAAPPPAGSSPELHPHSPHIAGRTP